MTKWSHPWLPGLSSSENKATFWRFPLLPYSWVSSFFFYKTSLFRWKAALYSVNVNWTSKALAIQPQPCRAYNPTQPKPRSANTYRLLYSVSVTSTNDASSVHPSWRKTCSHSHAFMHWRSLLLCQCPGGILVLSQTCCFRSLCTHGPHLSRNDVHRTDTWCWQFLATSHSCHQPF